MSNFILLALLVRVSSGPAPATGSDAEVERQIRRLGFGLLVLFLILFAQINYIQVFAADRIANDPRTPSGSSEAEYEVDRGSILANDGDHGPGVEPQELGRPEVPTAVSAGPALRAPHRLLLVRLRAQRARAVVQRLPRRRRRRAPAADAGRPRPRTRQARRDDRHDAGPRDPGRGGAGGRGRAGRRRGRGRGARDRQRPRAGRRTDATTRTRSRRRTRRSSARRGTS